MSAVENVFFNQFTQLELKELKVQTLNMKFLRFNKTISNNKWKLTKYSTSSTFIVVLYWHIHFLMGNIGSYVP